MKIADFLFTEDTSKLDEFIKTIDFSYEITNNKNIVLYYNKDNDIRYNIFTNFDCIYIQDLTTNKQCLLSHNFDLDSIIKGLKDYFKVSDGKTFELERILLKADDKFFEKLQDKDFYIIDSGDTKIVLEHSKWKTKMVIIIDSINRISVVFYNSINACYCNGSKFTWFLGDKDNLCLDDVFNIIERDDFLIFCQGTSIHEGSKDWKIKKLEDIENYTDTQKKIKEICDEIAKLLINKNKKYGNSALEPKNIFYKGNAENSILIRLDDKIGRIINSNDGIRTNDIVDIIGYLVLLLISKNINLEEIQRLKD